MSETPYRTPLRPTPFDRRTAALCRARRWTGWAGYAAVECYGSVEQEYFAIRNTATLYDISPMTKYRIAGPEAARYANRLVTRDVGRLTPGGVAYVVWCDDAGKVLDDGTLFRLGEQEFRLCCQERHLCWLLDSAAGFDVTIADVTDDIAALALQGPTSCAVLRALGLAGIETLRPFRWADFAFAGGRLTVSRTGFTGDLGYELWAEPGSAEALWDGLMAAGRHHGIRPIGSAAIELARIEAGFIQANTDFIPAEAALRPTRARSPFELGLGWMVDFDKGHFVGRRALLRERENGSRYGLVGLEVEGDKPARDALVYHGRSRQVGAVTSAIWSPSCKRNIAIATLEAPYSTAGEGLWAEIYVSKELKWEKVVARCRIVERPFFDPPRRKAVPALDR